MGWVNAISPPRKIGHRLAQLLNEPFLIRYAPFLLRLQHQEHVRLVQAHRIETQLVGAGAGDNLLNFRHLLAELPLDERIGFEASGEAD